MKGDWKEESGEKMRGWIEIKRFIKKKYWMRRREWKEKERLRIECENGREWGDVKRLIGWCENERVERGEDELGEKVERVEVEEIVDRERDSGR